MATIHLTERARIPWGKSPGIPEVFVREIGGSLATGEPPRLRRAPVRVRPGGDGSIGLLALDPMTGSGRPPRVLRLAEGAIAQEWEIPPPVQEAVLQWRILDFALDRQDGLYFLELVLRDEGDLTLLRKIGPDGTEAWRRSGRSPMDGFDLDRLEGDFQRLLIGDGANVYLSATRHRGLVARIDPDDGHLTPYADWGSWTGEALMGPDERIYFVRFVPERNARAWVRLDPETGRETQVLGDPEAFDLLALPIGVDSEGRAYGVHLASVGCVGPQGSVIWRESPRTLIQSRNQDLEWESALSWRVGPDGTVYLPTVGSDAFHLLALEWEER